MKLSVMTFNIHKGKHSLLTKQTLDHIRDFLKSHNVDILLLQEVIGLNSKSNSIDQVAYIAEALTSRYCYGGTFITETYHHGNAILSRYPIVDWKNDDITTNRYEKRGILSATLELPQQRLVKAFCCHLNLLRESRKTQMKKIAELIDEGTRDFQGPFFIGGDFNDWRRDAAEAFKEKGWSEVGIEGDRKHFLTFPAWWPRMALDRIYYQGAKLRSAEVVSFGELGYISDHLPILGSFEMT